MSTQVQSPWKVLDNNNVTNKRRSERGKRNEQAKSEEVTIDAVKNEIKETKQSKENEKVSESSALEAVEVIENSTDNNMEANKMDSSNTRKNRSTLSRRKQVMSKRALRKAGEINGDEQVVAETKPTPNKSSEQDEFNSIHNIPTTATTTTTTTTTTTAASEVTDHSNNNTTTTNTTVNVWEARRQQQLKKSDSVPSSQPTKSISSSAYRPPKVLPSIVQPAKQLNVEAPKAASKEQVSTATASVATTSPSRFGTSGYRPPHQRGDAAIVKPPEDSEDYPKKERMIKGNPREREREREREKDATTVKTSGPERALTREDMGKGYKTRSQQDQEVDDKRSNDKKLEEESPRDYGNQRKGYSRNQRKDDSWAHSNSRFNANATDDSHRDNTNTHKKDKYFSKNDINTMSRSQSLQNEPRLARSAIQSSAGSLTKTYSAPKEQLTHAVKLHGSIEQKDEKILKIKQQTKEKAKVQNATGATAMTIGGFQPILSSAEDALRSTFDGNEDITRENAELVKQELKTNLNPLGPEFAPQQHISEINTSLDQGQFVMDQSGEAMQPGQSMVGMYPAYDEQISNELDHMRDPNTHLSWSFHPSDQSIYAQDIGDMSYDMGHYPAFGGDGVIGGGVGGPGNVTGNGMSLSGNTSAGGPPSQSPEQMPASHTLNEAYNTQSTATMAPQPQTFAASSGGDTSTTLQVTSDGQQSAHDVVAQGSQMFAGNDYTVNNTGVIGSDGLNYASQPFYPQGYDPNAMWGHADNVQNYLGWPMHPQQHHQRMNQQHGGHKQFQKRKKSSYEHKNYRGLKQHRFGDSERGGSHSHAHAHGHTHAHPHSHHHQNHDGQKKMKRPKKKIGKKGNFGNYRTKEHGFGSQNNVGNGIPNDAEANNNGQNIGMQQHGGINNIQNANQWQNYSTEYDGGYHEATRMNAQQNMIEREDTKEDRPITIPKQFETLTLSGWFVIIESLNPQHLDKFQNQLFATSPVSLKTFRLEIPSLPIRSTWANRVQWNQLTEYLSQANLEHVVITSHSPTKLDEFNNDQDFQHLEPVAKLVSTLKCKCLILERAPCKITPEYIQSLSSHIEELKLLCPSIQWNVDLVRSLSPKLTCLGLICPNTIAIDEFLDTLGDKTQRLCLCNDDFSPRKLSPQDVSELFQRVLSLELDRSLLTEIHPTPKTTTTKINELIIRLKDEVPEKDFYEKHSLPKTVTKFEVCPVDRSFMIKRWHGTVTHEDSKVNSNLQRAQNAELEHDRTKRESTLEDNKTASNSQDQQTHSTEAIKMTFKDKLKSSQKNVKKNPLRIEGQTL